MATELEKSSADKVIDKIKELNIPEGRDFTNDEKAAIDRLFKEVKDEAGKKKVRDYIENHLKGDSRNQLLSLSNDITSKELSKNPTFSDFKESLGAKNEIMDKLFFISNTYFDSKLKDSSLSVSEKEKIKLVLWDKLLNSLNAESGMGIIVGEVNTKLQTLSSEFGIKTDSSNKTSFSPENLIERLTNIESELSTKGESESRDKLFGSFDSLMGDSFDNIKKAKTDNKKLDTIQSISSITYPNDPKNKEKTFDEIKTNTLDKIKTFNELKSTGDNVKNILAELPANFGNEIIDFLKQISEQYPILGFIMSLFLGDGFLDGSEKKLKDSVINLTGFVEKEGTNSPFKKLGVDDLKGLDPKKLEKFHKYLDSKGIDYSKEDFWKGVLTGKTDDKKVLEIYNTLKDKDGNILGKDAKLDGFITKLNGISKLASQKEDEELEKLEEAKPAETAKPTEVKTAGQETEKIKTTDQKPTETKTVELKTAETAPLKQTLAEPKPTEPKPAEAETAKPTEAKPAETIKPTETTKPVEKEPVKQTPEVISRINELKLKKSIRNISNLPADVNYEGKLLKLNIENNNIVIGDSKYKVSIQALGGERFESLEFVNGNFIMNNKKDEPIDDNELVSIVKDLLSTGSHDFSGTSSGISYTGKISKLS